MYEQREIVLIPFPYSDLTGSKKRPALIISNTNVNNTEDRICCLVTSNIHKNDLQIENTDLQKGALPLKSSIRAHRVFTIDQRIIIKKLCMVTTEFHKKVIAKINMYLKEE